MCIEEVTVEDMMHRQICDERESCWHGGVMGKGNGSQPLSDEEEDWEIWLSENYDEGNHDEGGRRGTSKDEGGRQGLSKGSGSEDEEVRRRSGPKV
jgi:hypothetical protein